MVFLYLYHFASVQLSRGMTNMDRLLEGIRVLDLTNVLAGPFGAYQLALLGADVIKVEAPGCGDLARQLGADADLNRKLMGASFLAQNAGKRSVTVNLKSEAGRQVFRRLVGRSEEHTSELQSLAYLVCRLLLEKKKKNILTSLYFLPQDRKT